MKTKTNIVRFTTMKPFNLPQLELILGFQQSALEKVAGKYALYGNADRGILDCPVPDFYYEEVMKWRTSGDDKINVAQKNAYDRLVQTFGQDAVDLLVVKDLHVVTQRAKDILDLAMDKVFKCDELGVVIESENLMPMNYDDVPHAIYWAVRNMYQCNRRDHVWIKTDQGVHRVEAFIITKKKEDQE